MEETFSYTGKSIKAYSDAKDLDVLLVSAQEVK